MLRRRLFPLAALSLTACRRRRDLATVRVLAMPYPYMAPLYLASEQGYFTQEGLHVVVDANTASNIAIAMLAGGQADAAFYAISPALVNAITRGARVRIVAGRQFNAPECADARRLLGARAAFPKGFTEFRQLKGKRVGLSHLASPIAFGMDACLSAGGLTRDDIRIVLIKDNEGTAMLTSGSLDVLVSTSEEMHLTRLRNRVVLGPALTDAYPGYMYSYVGFGRRFLDEDLESGVRFLRAFLRGARDFTEGKTPQFLMDLIRRNGLEPDTPNRLCRKGTAVDGRIPETDIQRFLDWCMLRKHVPRPVRAADLIDTRFLERLRGGGSSSRSL